MKKLIFVLALSLISNLALAQKTAELSACEKAGMGDVSQVYNAISELNKINNYKGELQIFKNSQLAVISAFAKYTELTQSDDMTEKHNILGEIQDICNPPTDNL